MASRFDRADESTAMFRCDTCPRVVLLRDLAPSQRAHVERNPKAGIRCKQCIAARVTRESPRRTPIGCHCGHCSAVEAFPQ